MLLQGGTIEAQSDRPLYLHFLNRELARAAGASLGVPALGDYLLLAATMSGRPLLSSIALLWESGLLDSDFAGVTSEMVADGQFLLVSEFLSLDSFIDSCQRLYQDDYTRYPMYFGHQSDAYAPVVPRITKDISTTSSLEYDIKSIIDSRINTIAGLARADVQQILEQRVTLNRMIAERRGRGITLSLYNRFSERPPDLAIGRLFSYLHLNHYLDFTNASIMTGIPGLGFCDSIRPYSPNLDVRYVEPLLSHLGLGRKLRLRLAHTIGTARSSREHLLFLSMEHSLVNGFYNYYNRRRPENSATMPDMGEMEWSDFLLRHDPKWPAIRGASNLYAELSTRISQLTLTARQHIAGFSEFQDMERSMQRASRILILVATEVERDALIQAFRFVRTNTPAAPTRTYLKRHTVFHLGLVGNAEVLLAQSEAGTVDPGSAGYMAIDLIDQVQPDYLILAGICFGLQESNQEIGDILVSTRVRAMDLKKLVEHQDGKVDTLIRGDRASASVTLVDRFRSACIDWPGPKVHFGLILSSNMLVNAVSVRDGLRQTEPDGMGGEMEGAGIYAAGANRKVDWIIVKGICDWGMRKTDDFQRMAAENAARYVAHVVSAGGLDRPPGL
jgi:nucleoside phosphorylase